MSTRRMTRPGVVVLAAVLVAFAALAVAAFGRPGTPVTRAQQAHDIASSLHCPVCKDLSAADSPAPLARQMREQIRQKLAAGASPAQIRSDFVDAYGPSVLMSPPNQGWGRAAHLAPLVLLSVAVLLGAATVRRGLRSRADMDAPSAGESRREVELPGRDARAGWSARPRRARLGVGLSVAALATVAVMSLLLGSLDKRAEGSVPTAGAAGPRAAAATGAPTRTAANALTADQLADVEAAVRTVKSHPRQASAHVELARAYTEVGQPQLAAVEYLAATHLDPGNADANTALALVAFQAGSARRAEALVSKVLLEHPGYPEALYTRGLIRAMGLHQPAAATRDLKAYQRVAPMGSHRTTVATVLALLSSGAVR